MEGRRPYGRGHRRHEAALAHREGADRKEIAWRGTTSIKTVYPMDSMVSEGDDVVPATRYRTTPATFAVSCDRPLPWTWPLCGSQRRSWPSPSPEGPWYVGAGAAVTSGLLIDNEEAVKVLDSYDISTGEYAYIIVAGRFDSTYLGTVRSTPRSRTTRTSSRSATSRLRSLSLGASIGSATSSTSA